MQKLRQYLRVCARCRRVERNGQWTGVFEVACELEEIFDSLDRTDSGEVGE